MKKHGLAFVPLLILFILTSLCAKTEQTFLFLEPQDKNGGKQWIDNNNIDEEKITLIKFKNNEWQTIPTSYIDEDSLYLYYEAITTSTSTYAIVGNEIPTEQNDEEKPVEISWWIIIGVILIGVVFVIILLFKTGYLYFEPKQFSDKRRRKF